AEATTATLSIDGKKIKTLKLKGGTQGAGIFTVNSGKYKSGSHRIRIVTKYTNGAQIVKTGKFSRCAVRTAARRVSPQFTG
ncbi:MAG TPA: hypothetical protein VGO97_05105, partial [Solirubrobacterales bacterium]|nr:hypothetical protein [Solirubrobacterales bacterium]